MRKWVKVGDGDITSNKVVSTLVGDRKDHWPHLSRSGKKRYKVKSQNLIKPRQHSYSIVKVLNSASEMKILQYVTDLWTMNITFYKEKLNPLSSLMTGATYWCKKQTAIVLVSDRQRNAASQKLI